MFSTAFVVLGVGLCLILSGGAISALPLTSMAIQPSQLSPGWRIQSVVQAAPMKTRFDGLLGTKFSKCMASHPLPTSASSVELFASGSNASLDEYIERIGLGTIAKLQTAYRQDATSLDACLTRVYVSSQVNARYWSEWSYVEQCGLGLRADAAYPVAERSAIRTWQSRVRPGTVVYWARGKLGGLQNETLGVLSRGFLLEVTLSRDFLPPNASFMLKVLRSATRDLSQT